MALFSPPVSPHATLRVREPIASPYTELDADHHPHAIPKGSSAYRGPLDIRTKSHTWPGWSSSAAPTRRRALHWRVNTIARLLLVFACLHIRRHALPIARYEGRPSVAYVARVGRPSQPPAARRLGHPATTGHISEPPPTATTSPVSGAAALAPFASQHPRTCSRSPGRASTRGHVDYRVPSGGHGAARAHASRDEGGAASAAGSRRDEDCAAGSVEYVVGDGPHGHERSRVHGRWCIPRRRGQRSIRSDEVVRADALLWATRCRKMGWEREKTEKKPHEKEEREKAV
ncbi:hypothetical protein V8D89_008604 [Ganoderma adspersum]